LSIWRITESGKISRQNELYWGNSTYKGFSEASNLGRIGDLAEVIRFYSQEAEECELLNRAYFKCRVPFNNHRRSIDIQQSEA